jgi:squalene synthase HpnC
MGGTGGRAAEALSEVASRAPAQAAAENFPVALRVVPARPRAHLRRVYAYARFVDDVGDEAAGDRMGLLEAVEADVRALWGGTPRLPVVAALRSLIDDCGTPAEPFLDLIEANRLDQTVRSYATFEDLLGYCRYSAAPVGRLVLYVAGAVTPANVADSDVVCNALQVLEHCQDVGEDARAGRVYLPADDLGDVHDGDLTSTVTSPALRRAIRTQVERAVSMLGAGEPLVRRLRGWSRFAVAGYLAGGYATADALRRANFEVLARPVRPSKARTAARGVRLAAGLPVRRAR